jgi:hypothetical protein
MQLECIGSSALPRALGCYERQNRSDIRKGLPANVTLAAPINRYIELSQVSHGLAVVSLRSIFRRAFPDSWLESHVKLICESTCTCWAFCAPAFLPQTSANGSRASMNITSPFARAVFEQSSAQVQLCYSDSYSDGAAMSSRSVALSYRASLRRSRVLLAGVDIDIPDFDAWTNDTEVGSRWFRFGSSRLLSLLSVASAVLSGCDFVCE